MKTYPLFGVPITVGSRAEQRCAVKQLLSTGGQIYTPNAKMLVLAAEDERFCRVLARGSLCLPDGRSVVRTLARIGITAECYPGVELGEEVFALGGLRIAMLGGQVGVAEAAFCRLNARYGFQNTAVYLKDGYHFDPASVQEALADSCPDVCFVCLGTPAQELLIDQFGRALPHVLFLGLGGSLDVYAGRLRRAPRPFRAFGIEWLYRMLRQPSRFAALPTLVRYAYRSEKAVRTHSSTKSHGDLKKK